MLTKEETINLVKFYPSRAKKNKRPYCVEDRKQKIKQKFFSTKEEALNYADQIAENILNTQGAQQLPNAGNFSSVNQPPRTLASERERVQTNTRPVIPGSVEEQNLVARQIASPTRTGNRRVPGRDIGPGLGA